MVASRAAMAGSRAAMVASRTATPLVATLVLVGFVLAIYGPGIGKGFVKDDVVWVSATHVTSWSDARALLFRTDGFYRPVVAATFALDRAMYGLEPFGFGVTNFVLLLLSAAALAYLGMTLGLRPTAAVVAGGVWTLNFHAVNMAVLWLSGRSALCVAIAALLSAAAFVKQKPIIAGMAALVAMLAKEEAVLLPVIFSGWAWVLGERARPSVRDVIRLTGPTWIALAVYFGLRAQTAAMTPWTANENYRFLMSPGPLAGNALEYLDRVCTASLIVLLLAHLIARHRPAMTPDIRRALMLGGIWLVGTFALTVFVPSRSSLYALLPSAAPALVTGFLLQHLWDATAPSAGRRLVAAAVVVPLLLLPVYWSRNVRWVEIAELSSETFGVIRQVVRDRPETQRLVFHDDRSTRRSFANAYDQLLPEAVRLVTGRDIRVEIEPAGARRDDSPHIVLENGQVRVD